MGIFYRLDGSAYDNSRGDAWLQWARDMEAYGERRIAQDMLWNGLWVSTIWLGLDHSFGFGPPLIFETMVFDHLHGDRGDDLAQERYSTLEDAQLGHLFLVEEYGRFWPTVRRWFLSGFEIGADPWWED